MNKKLIRLTESDLHRIVKESVNKTLKEGLNDNEGFEKFAKYTYEANSALKYIVPFFYWSVST